MTVLSAAQQPLRAAALQLLCCFDPPQLLELGVNPNDPMSRKVESGAQRCDLLEVLRDINSDACSIDNGRRWGVSIARMATNIEYKR